MGMAKVVMVFGLVATLMTAMAMITEGKYCEEKNRIPVLSPMIPCKRFLLDDYLTPECCAGTKRVYSNVDRQAICNCLTADDGSGLPPYLLYTRSKVASVARVCKFVDTDCLL